MTGLSAMERPLWAALPVPAFLLDAQDRFVAINPAAEGFLNRSAKSVIGRQLHTQLQIDAPLRESLARVRKGHATLFINDVAVATQFQMLASCNIQISSYSADNGPAGQLLVLMSPQEGVDIKNAGQSSKKAAKTAIGMAEILSHEIKNPLAGITGAAQLLAMNLNKRDQEMTDLIVSECRRIVTLLDRVDQFGNLRPPDCRAVNLHDALDRARKSAQMGRAAHMRFVEDYDPSLPHTWADADQLQQVFLNLITNAAQAAGSRGGTITLRSFYEHSLRLRRRDGQGDALPLHVEIADDGPGLPDDIAEDVFEPFVSGQENGTGLGLALVSKIIADHGGWITVTSNPGKTVFRLSFPVAPKQAADENSGD